MQKQESNIKYKNDNPDYWKSYYENHKNELIERQRKYRKIKNLKKEIDKINDILNNLKDYNVELVDGQLKFIN